MQAPYYGTVNQTGSLKTGLALRTARLVNRLTVNIPTQYQYHSTLNTSLLTFLNVLSEAGGVSITRFNLGYRYAVFQCFVIFLSTPRTHTTVITTLPRIASNTTILIIISDKMSEHNGGLSFQTASAYAKNISRVILDSIHHLKSD